MALVDADSNVIQFISYEGSFTAASGPASGMTSTDIGVSEPGTSSVGHSLQLTGSGCMIADFTWAAPVTNTFGAVNTGQTHDCSSSPVATHIIINEVDADTPGIDTAEFIELYDGGTGNTNLSGLTLVFSMALMTNPIPCFRPGWLYHRC